MFSHKLVKSLQHFVPNSSRPEVLFCRFYQQNIPELATFRFRCSFLSLPLEMRGTGSVDGVLNSCKCCVVKGDGSQIQAALAEWTGQRTVPNVFIGGNHIGGCDATTAMHREGKLKPLLTQAGALKSSA